MPDGAIITHTLLPTPRSPLHPPAWLVRASARGGPFIPFSRANPKLLGATLDTAVTCQGQWGPHHCGTDMSYALGFTPKVSCRPGLLPRATPRLTVSTVSSLGQGQVVLGSPGRAQHHRAPRWVNLLSAVEIRVWGSTVQLFR